MTEKSGHNSPPELTDGGTDTSGGLYRSRPRNNGRGGKKNKGQREPKNSFKGPLTGYENYVYDVTKNSGSDAFNTTTVKLSEYLRDQYRTQGSS